VGLGGVGRGGGTQTAEASAAWERAVLKLPEIIIYVNRIVDEKCRRRYSLST
jgi:hypothetical protein